MKSSNKFDNNENEKILKNHISMKASWPILLSIILWLRSPFLFSPGFTLISSHPWLNAIFLYF